MKAHILDAEALCAISPAAIAAFARSESWFKIEGYGAHADVYAGAGRPEIIVPRTDLLADYASAVSRLIEVFAKCTDRDELVVYRDLVGADRDVVRVRVLGAEDDGSVALDAGVRIVTQARDMLLAAACAARTPLPVYRADANREANDYLRRVKLGQTEHGSFVVTLLAPVPPLLEPARGSSNGPAWTSLDDEPLERMVTRRLMEALAASRSAAEQALSGDGAAFEHAVAAGVSANLCEAVAGLIDQSAGVDISLTWARTRPTPEAQRKVAFSAKDAEILKEAARTFRQRQPRADVTLFGTVLRLKGDREEVEGVVTLRAMVDDRLQPVSAVLDQANYSIAVRAHDAKTPVIATGDLERVGHRWQMTNASLRELSPDDGSEEREAG
jgi:hypothetical protein